MTPIKQIPAIIPIYTKKQVELFFNASETGCLKKSKRRIVNPEKEIIAIRVKRAMARHYYNEFNGGFVSDYVPDKLVIQLGNLKRFYRNDNVFIKSVCAVISHEVMHKVLLLNNSEEACWDFDNICNELIGYGVALKMSGADELINLLKEMTSEMTSEKK